MNYSAKMRFYRKSFMSAFAERNLLEGCNKSYFNADLRYWLNELGGLGGVW